MGSYLNPGNQLFCEALNSEIYVDKSELIRYTNSWLNTRDKLVCVSRPRRFGKSMALEMLAAYYSKGCDSRKLFARLKLGDFRSSRENKPDSFRQYSWDSAQKQNLFEQGLNRYDTLCIDMQGIITDVLTDADMNQTILEFVRDLPGMSSAEKELIQHPLLSAIQRRIIDDIREEESCAACIAEKESSLGNALLNVYKNTGKQFVILIDEWDCIFRNYEDNEFLQDKYIDFLRGLFKNARLLPAYALVYMTGILPVKRYKTQSALNNFREYTMLNMTPLERFTGFTEEETARLYRKYGMDFQKAQEWYDGYQLENFGHIYNPNSVVQSVCQQKFKNYWTATGTYESVKQPLEMNFDGLKERVITLLGGGKCAINTNSFSNTMTHFENADDVMTLLIHLGYLGFDSEKSEVYIPNKEIRNEFVSALNGNKWTLTHEAIARSAARRGETGYDCGTEVEEGRSDRAQSDL